MASHETVILRAHFMRPPTFFINFVRKNLDMDSPSYTKDTYLKEELLHPTLTRVLWIVCMEIIQK